MNGIGAGNTAGGERSAFLDGWRLLAVSLVLLSHLSLSDAYRSAMKRFHLSFLFDYGMTGVQIFFFISGYVVSISCLREVQSSGSLSLPAFYVRRTFRIIPPFFGYVLACSILGYLNIIEFDLGNIVWSSTYMCNVGFSRCGWYGGHLWSLSFEEQFYLVFPLLFLVFINKTVRARYLVGLILAVLLAFVPFIYPVNWIGRTGFITIYGLFVFGFVAARHNDVLLAWIQPRARALFGICLLFIFVCPYVVTTFLFLDAGFQDFFFKYFKISLILFVPVMVLSSFHTSVRSILEMPFLTYLGQVSYSIYLWQQFVMGGLFNNRSIVEHAGYILLMVLLCALSFEFFEKPLIGAGRSISARIRGRRFSVSGKA